MARRVKPKRCAVEGCNKTINVRYSHCFEHKNTMKRSSDPEILIRMNRFFCNGCGTTSHAYSHYNCQLCGGATEEYGSDA